MPRKKPPQTYSPQQAAAVLREAMRSGRIVRSEELARLTNRHPLALAAAAGSQQHCGPGLVATPHGKGWRISEPVGFRAVSGYC